MHDNTFKIEKNTIIPVNCSKQVNKSLFFVFLNLKKPQFSQSYCEINFAVIFLSYLCANFLIGTQI